MSTHDRPPFLDTSDPETWKAQDGLALKVSRAAEGAGLVDRVNACDRVSILSEHPVRPR